MFQKCICHVVEKADPSMAIKFLEEAMIMKNFDHPNVLGLRGLTFDPTGSPLVLLPFMKNGNLKSYITEERVSLCHKCTRKFLKVYQQKCMIRN